MNSKHNECKKIYDLQTKDKRKPLKVAREKHSVVRKSSAQEGLLVWNHGGQRDWHTLFQALREKNSQPQTLYAPRPKNLQERSYCFL